MGQLLTLMVFGDAITVNNDDEVEGGEMNGASISGPPGLEIRDPEICRGQTVRVTSGEHRGDKSGTDGAGQRDGQFHHDSSVLEPRSSVVQQHRAVLDGNRRVLVSGSGDERDRSGDDDGTGQHELMYIMHIPDEDARLHALRRYLTATGKSQSAT